MLSTKPRGKHVVKFCESAPCHVAGGQEVWDAVKEALAIGENETTPDGKWTLITTSCLGVCGVGPVMMIDDNNLAARFEFRSGFDHHPGKQGTPLCFFFVFPGFVQQVSKPGKR